MFGSFFHLAWLLLHAYDIPVVYCPLWLAGCTGGVL